MIIILIQNSMMIQYNDFLSNMVFNNVFNSSCDNVEIVTDFLGVLELGRMKQVDIEQKYLFSDINVTEKNNCNIDIDTSTLNY